MFDISPPVLWLIAAAVVLGCEIFLGTAYLLAVAFAFAVSSVAAAMKFDFTGQLVACAVALAVGSLSIMTAKRWLARRKDPSKALQNLDEGQCVKVETVSSDGFAVVQYRGATWIARSEGSEPLTSGLWTIARVDGTQLVLGKRI